MGGLQVSYPVVFWSLLVLGMPLLVVQPYLRISFLASAQLAAAASMFVQFEEASSHDPPII